MKTKSDFPVGTRVEHPLQKAVEPVTREELIELLADQEHDRWSRWEKWREEAIQAHDHTDVGEPPLDRWRRQRETPYANLSEREKESDRKEARQTIELLRKVFLHQRSWAEMVVVAITEEFARQGIEFPATHGEGLEPKDYVSFIQELASRPPQ